MTPRDVVPLGWTALLRGGALTWGLDLATTEKATSNPSSLTFTEKWDGMFVERLVLAWKTSNEEVTEAIVKIALEDVMAAGLRCRNGNIDASNEVFFAQALKKKLMRFCTIQLIKGGEKIQHGVENFDAKTLLGSHYVNAHTDGQIATPSGTWIKDDRRLMKRNKGRFECDLGRMGEHGDTFDSGKLALWGHVGRGGGRVEATAMQVGTFGGGSAVMRALKNPFARLFGRRKSHTNA